MKRIAESYLPALALLVTTYWILAVTPIALADGFTFTKVADTTTPIPGAGGGNFSSVYLPVVSGQYVGFFGNNSQGSTGVYRWDGTSIGMIADANTPTPNSTGNFYQFNTLSQYGPITYFSASNLVNNSAIQAGVYSSSGGGTITVVEDTGTQIEKSNGSGTFHNAVGISPWQVSADSGLVAAATGMSDGQAALVTNASGAFSSIDDQYRLLPGSPGLLYQSMDQVVTRNGSIAFSAQWTNAIGTPTGQGIYLATGKNTANISLIANQNTQLPGGSSTLGLSAVGLSADGSHVAFDTSSGVYVYNNATGVLSAAVDTNTLVPGTSTHFGPFFGGAEISNGDILFEGSSISYANETLYLWNGDSLTPIFSVGDMLDGKTISAWSYSADSFRDGELALTVDFTDGSRGIFVGAVPEPGAGLLILGCTMALIRRPKRR